MLADYPYNVEASSAGEALLKVTHGNDAYPYRASEVDWEICRDGNWAVRNCEAQPQDELWINEDGRVTASRVGFIGVRRDDAQFPSA